MDICALQFKSGVTRQFSMLSTQRLASSPMVLPNRRIESPRARTDVCRGVVSELPDRYIGVPDSPMSDLRRPTTAFIQSPTDSLNRMETKSALYRSRQTAHPSVIPELGQNALRARLARLLLLVGRHGVPTSQFLGIRPLRGGQVARPETGDPQEGQGADQRGRRPAAASRAGTPATGRCRGHGP
jgi:hypothetical protein